MAAGRIIVTCMPALDSNGRPVAGALLNFYENGTTTRKAVYTTADLDVPLSNPVVADSAGAFPSIFADQDELYTVTCFSPLGVMLPRGSYSDVAASESVTDLEGSITLPIDSPEVNFLPAWAGAITRTVRDKLRDLPHVYDIIAPANRNTAYDATTDLQKCADAGEQFILPLAEIRKSGPVTFTNGNSGFTGQGKGSRIVDTSATGDVFTLGDNVSPLIGMLFRDFSVWSTQIKSSGYVFNCRQITNSLFENVRAGSVDDYVTDGMAHRLKHGYYFDRFGSCIVAAGEVCVEGTAVACRGQADNLFGAELALDLGLNIYGAEIGLHQGGATGGVFLGRVSMSVCGIGWLVDETLQPGAYNREGFCSFDCAIDTSGTAGVVFDQDTASVARFMISKAWVCATTGGGPGVWVKKLRDARLVVAVHAYANTGDGVKIDDANAIVYIEPDSLFDLNSGWGVNPTVATSRLTIGQARFLANGLGTVNPALNPPYAKAELPPITVGLVNAANDAAAAAAGVPINGEYHNSGAKRIRLT